MRDRYNRPEFDGVEHTVLFIDTIVRIWRIWNVRSPAYYIRKRQEESKPFSSATDDRLEFSENFIRWIKAWESSILPSHHRKFALSVDTTKALIRTALGLSDIIKHLLQFNFVKYVLPG